MERKGQYIWSLLGRFLPSVIFLFATIIMARILTPRDFGLVGVLAILFTVAGALTDAGLGGSLIKEKTLSDIDCCTIFNFNIIISVALYIIFFSFADYIEAYFNMPQLSFVTRLLSLSFVINAFSLVPKALMMRNLQFKALCIISVGATIIASLTSIVAAYCGMGVYSLVLYYLVSYFINSIFCFVYGHFNYSISFSKDSFKRLIPFGLFTSISTVIDTIYENILSSMFGKVMGATTAGHFYQAKKTEESITSSLASSVGLVAFPVLAKLRDDKDKFIKESRSVMLTITGMLFPVIGLLSVYSKEIIILLYGNQWLESVFFFRMLMYAGCFMIVENLNRSFIKSLGLGKELFYVALLKRIIGILLLFIVAFLNKSFLIHTYIFCSFLGYLINQIFVSSNVGTHAYREIFCLLKVFIPNIILLLLFYGICMLIHNYIFEGLIDFVMLLLYYYLYLPQIGIRLPLDATNSMMAIINKKEKND